MIMYYMKPIKIRFGLKSKILLKTITYRIFATLVTLLMVFVLTGNIGLSISIGFLELISKLILYYIFEWGWIKLNKKNEQHI